MALKNGRLNSYTADGMFIAGLSCNADADELQGAAERICRWIEKNRADGRAVTFEGFRFWVKGGAL